MRIRFKRWMMFNGREVNPGDELDLPAASAQVIIDQGAAESTEPTRGNPAGREKAIVGGSRETRARKKAS